MTGSSASADTVDTTLVLAGSEVLISYPQGFGLATTSGQLPAASQIPPCDDGFDYCIYLDPAEFEGTNFSSAGVRIQQREDLSTEADCVLTQPSGYSDLLPIIAGASDFATTMYQAVGQGAAGQVSEGSLGRLYYDSACFEFETRIAYAQFSNFPAGAVREFDAGARQATVDRLLSVLDGVTLPDGRAGLWARKVAAEQSAAAPDPEPGAALEASDAPAMPTMSQPLAGAHVASPLLLVGEAPGTWFFEGSFPYQLVVPDGTVLAGGAVTAREDWMTEGTVSFEATVEFEVATETNAVLVLSKDNPSGLPENDASYETPLLLLP